MALSKPTNGHFLFSSYTYRTFDPCGKCAKHCDEKESFIIHCKVCEKSFHRSCLNLSKRKYKQIIDRDDYFVCSRKCYHLVLPLTQCDAIDLFSALFGEGDYPCGRCKRDCLDNSPCISCSICDKWFHFECSNLNADEFNNIPYYFCSSVCEMCIFPFTNVETGLLVKNDILHKKANVSRKPKPEKLKSNSKLNVKSLPSVKFDHFVDINCNYVDPGRITDEFIGNDHSFTIYQNNIRSLNKNIDSIQEEIFMECTEMPDILAFSETKLNQNSTIPGWEGYSFEHVDSLTDFGGVGIFIKNEIDYNVRDDLSINSTRCEDLWIEFKIKSAGCSLEKFVVGIIYRHPNQKYNSFCENLCKTLETLSQSKTNYILVGDYNIDIGKYNCVSSVTNYINTLNSYGCLFHVDKPTRVTSNSASCIDHVYSNLNPDRLLNHIVICDVSDHYGILTKVCNVEKCYDKDPIYYRRSNLSPQEWKLFNEELKYSIDQKLLSLDQDLKDDIDHFAACITDSCQELIEKFMPNKKLSRKRRHFLCKPWISKGLRISIRTKNKLHRSSLKSTDPVTIGNYKKYRNLLSRLKNKAKNIYYANLASRFGNDKSKTWRLINEITNRKKSTKPPITYIIDKDGQKITDRKHMTNHLNEYFSNIGEEMNSAFKKTSSSTKNPLEYIPLYTKEEFTFKATNKREITKVISDLNNKKTSGYDLISNYILKSCCSTIVPYITKLFNQCFTKNIFPSPYKIALVVPIFKGGNKGDVSCYRPISLLPVLGKLLEKIAYKQTLNHLIDNNLLTEKQFGFRKGLSTEYAIVDIYEKLLNNLDKGLNSCAIFLDLKKAFDSVDHEILLGKLSRYGITGNALEFFRSYLSLRSQQVKLGTDISKQLFIKVGVPQGSVLGPLLFLIFINDLPYASDFFIKLFADDTFLCLHDSDIIELEKNVNIEINKVYDWLVANKLSLNIAKSKYMIITNKKIDYNTFKVVIDKTRLEHCDKYKYLGVFIDKNLNWKYHIEYISNKISKACGSLSKLRHIMSTDVLKEVYYALIHSYIKYGITTWGNASNTTLNPLKVLINRAVRIISFAPYGRIDLKPIYNSLKFLDFESTFRLETSKLMFKRKHDIFPIPFANHFVDEYSVSHCYNLRNRELTATSNSRPNPRLASSKKSLYFRGEEVWENTPETLRNAPSFNSFKKLMKGYILEP